MSARDTKEEEEDSDYPYWVPDSDDEHEQSKEEEEEEEEDDEEEEKSCSGTFSDTDEVFSEITAHIIVELLYCLCMLQFRFYFACFNSELFCSGRSNWFLRIQTPSRRIRQGWLWLNSTHCQGSLITCGSLNLHSTCSECMASAAMSRCSPKPKHASGDDGTWSQGLVASRPIEWQRETLGCSPFQHARLLCNVHARRECNSQIRVVMLEDLVVLCNQFIQVSHSILMLCKLHQF